MVLVVREGLEVPYLLEATHLQRAKQLVQALVQVPAAMSVIETLKRDGKGNHSKGLLSIQSICAQFNIGVRSSNSF